VGRTIHAIIQTAHKRGKRVTICGEMAADLRMIPLLLGWEIDGLSVSTRMYLRVKNHIRKLYFNTCSDLAQAALLMGSSEEIRNLTEENNQHEDS
jgi:phosphotransferase system enzyme I (PtsI)